MTDAARAPFCRPLAYAAPYRKVVGVVRFRVGWAVFLECQGHVMFVDRLGRSGPRYERLSGRGFPAVATAETIAEAEAPVEAWPKRMRCLTCAGVARHDRPIYMDRSSSAQRPEEVRAELERDLARPAQHPLRRLADERVTLLADGFVRRVRRDGKHEVVHRLAAAFKKARRGLGPTRRVET